jgi:hypothetical protein
VPRNALVWKNGGREAPSCPISRLPARTPFNPDRPQLQPRITLDAATTNQPPRGDERQPGTKGQDQCCATRDGQGLGWPANAGPPCHWTGPALRWRPAEAAPGRPGLAPRQPVAPLGRPRQLRSSASTRRRRDRPGRSSSAPDSALSWSPGYGRSPRAWPRLPRTVCRC